MKKKIQAQDAFDAMLTESKLHMIWCSAIIRNLLSLKIIYAHCPAAEY